MSERVTMPALGESVTEGTVTRWLKNVGDTVEVDEPLLEVSTDKVDTEIPSPVAGVLQEILANEDDTVPVGADLAVIGDGSDSGASDSGDTSDDASDDAGQQDSGEQASQEQASAESEEPPAEAPSTEQAPQESTAEPEAEAAQGSDSGSSESSSSDDDSGSGDSGSGGDSSGGGETVTMPALGESVTEGTVTRWLKAEGDTVEVDEPLLEVSTDKVDTEIPSPFAGTLSKILVQEDDTVPVGGDLAVIGGSGSTGGSGDSAPAKEAPKQEEPKQEAAPAEKPKAETPKAEAPKAEAPKAEAPKAEAPKAEAPKEQPKQAESAPAPQAPSSDGQDASAYVTPLVRKLASEHKVDLGSLKGTGVGGRIRKQDVLEA
ncbi:MAG: biotin/lipoyl-containing protein, partial [Pedococcus sp.]